MNTMTPDDAEYDEDSDFESLAINDDLVPEYFEGDSGDLPLIARKALVLLVKRTHVTAITHPKEWQAILDHQVGISRCLNNFFLVLRIDEGNEVAYKSQAGQDLPHAFPTLVQNRAYSRDEVGVLIRLREVHRSATRDGQEAAYVEVEDLLDSLRYLRPPETRDNVQADKAAQRAIERLTEDRFLLKSTNDPQRLRVSPVIETLLTVERLPAFMDAMLAEDADDEDDPAEPPLDTTVQGELDDGDH